MHTPHWPLFELEVRTPALTLRYLDDELAHELCELMGRGVHDPAAMPFTVPWTDLAPPALERQALAFYWRSRADTTPDAWHLIFAVLVGPTVVGTCSLIAQQFRTLRTFETGSWLGLDHQGRGVGTEMRQACLHLGFAGLDARVATTGAWHDNGPSLGVTRKLGYRLNGTFPTLRRDVADEIERYRMDRDAWETIRRDDIEIVGLAGAREQLELS